MASHGRGRSAGGSSPHGEERRGTTSSPTRETSRGAGGGEEERRAQNLWCDYSKCVWYLDRASQDGSDPLQPPCGPLLFVAVCADRTRLAGSIIQWVDDGEYNFKFTLKKHYKSDCSVDGIAKGCKVVRRIFGGGPVGFAGGECSEREMGSQGGLPATPPDQEVGVSDDSEDNHPRAPLKPGLHVSCRHSLLGESTPHGGGDGERLRQGSESTTPRGLVREVRGSDETTRRARPAPEELQTELSQEREASGNVAGEEEVSEQGLFRERSAEKTQSGGKRNLPDEEEREGLGASKRQRKVGGSARTPRTREGGSVEKRKRVGGGDEMPKDSSTQRRTDDSVFALGLKFYEEWSKGKLLASYAQHWTEKPPTHEEVAKPGLSTVTDSQGLKKHVWYVKVDDPSLKKGRGKPKKGAEEKTFYVQVPEPDVHCWKELVDLMDREKKRLLNDVLNLNVVWVQTSSKKLAEQGKFSVKEMVDIIKMDRIMLRLWHYVEFKYEEMDKREWNANSTFFGSKKQLFEEFKDRGLDDKLWNESRKFFTDITYVNECPQFLGCQHDNNIKRTAALYVTHEVSSKAYPCDFHHVVVEPVYDPNKDMFLQLRFDPQYVVRKEVAIAVLQGYHGASRAGVVSFIKRLEYVFFNEDVVDPADFTLDKHKLAFGEEDDFNIETEQEESVEDDLFDLDGQLAIFNAQVSESPSVCKQGTPLATPTSGGPTPVSSSSPVKRGGLSRLRSSPGEPIRLTPQPERLRPGHPVPPDHLHLKAPATPFHMGDKHTFSTAEDWGHDIVWHPDHFQPVLLDGEWAVAVRDASARWIYDDRWDLETFKSRAYDAVLERLSEQVSWELPGVTPPAGVVKRKSRGKDGNGDGEGGGQRGTGGGSEQRSTKQRSPGRAGGGEGKKGSREKKKPRSGEKTKHHRGDGQGSDVDRDEDGGVLAVTGSTSMETGNDLRPGCITRPGEQDLVISSTSETHFVDAVGGAGVAKHGSCFAQLQKRSADCLGSIRTSETTSLSGTRCLPGSETTTYHGSGSDKLEPCSVSPQKEFWINPNREGRGIEGAQLSTELERVVWVFENPGDEIRIHPNQEAVSVMTDDRCQDAVMLCVEAHKELQADCRTEGELATSSNVEPNTLGAELAVVSDSPVKAVMSASLETAGARMNPNQGPVNISLPDASLETTVIRIHPRHTDEGLQLAGVEGCQLLTTLDKDNSADDRIDPTLNDVGIELPVQPGYDDPLYSALHNEAMGEDVLKKASDAVGDRFIYLSDDDKNTTYGDKKLRWEEVLLDIHGTLSPTQYDIVTMEKTQPVDVVDIDDLCPETNIPSTVIDADISSLSSFPVGLEHVVAASTRAGVPIVLGLPSVGSGEVVARPGFPRDGRVVLEDVICSRLPLTIIVARLPSHSLQVSVKDIVALVDRSGELNDEVVNFYMAMLLDDCGRTAATMKTYTFNSFFASSLLLRGPTTVLRWAKDVDLQSHDLVLAPVHKDDEH
ncbi:hypothetical protein CBR_g17166 [Chara braunii]|uniref:Ubiquitin-like protease family profile domain-containing protein n=1 Tax=Chara braunii TaxID=69332 RepID=A0A388KV04_CHABU|nr:hypothetical protein CBR_g17166 [Chara braunii]|eukprot:GBG73828.1 hypothetical protein CBR_g17166 [Chara braunii]